MPGLNELDSPGIEDILMAVVDGLKGISDAIIDALPKDQVQTCIVHLIGNSLDVASYEDRRAVVVGVEEIDRATDADAGKATLVTYDAGEWGWKYPAIAIFLHCHWQAVIPFFAFSDKVRSIIYITSAVQSLNSKLRRAVRTCGHFPNDHSAIKLLFLVLDFAEEAWRKPPREWAMAKAQFAILFEERLRAA